ncbi:MAG: hypothetical protein K2X90_01370 [Candidatus Babeliaceae bacterium]|nr:hypothetical protein [Candidatus Babeliaceae bacterium]
MYKILSISCLLLVNNAIYGAEFIKLSCHDSRLHTKFEEIRCRPKEFARRIALDQELLELYRCNHIAVYNENNNLIGYFSSALSFLTKYLDFDSIPAQMQTVAKMNLIHECLDRPFELNDPYDTQENRAHNLAYKLLQDILKKYEHTLFFCVSAEAIRQQLAKISRPALYAESDKHYKPLLYNGLLTVHCRKTCLYSQAALNISTGLLSETLTPVERDLAKQALKTIYPD